MNTLTERFDVCIGELPKTEEERLRLLDDLYAEFDDRFENLDFAWDRNDTAGSLHTLKDDLTDTVKPLLRMIGYMRKWERELGGEKL